MAQIQITVWNIAYANKYVFENSCIVKLLVKVNKQNLKINKEVKFQSHFLQNTIYKLLSINVEKTISLSKYLPLYYT